ncbi:MAG: trk system potassium uptake protein TrkH [Acidimicrobiales bacterium]
MWREARTWRESRVRHPGVVVVGWFLAVIAIGALLLRLPISQAGTEQTASMSDSLFTAASAVTVTGLSVTDTGTAWSPFGEFVLLVLIQIGGLGIMTLAGFIGITLNRRLGLRGGLLASTEIGVSDLGELRTLIGSLVRFVFGAELVVAILLTGRFLAEGQNSVLHSVHLGLFHAVSAFNNAGFSIIDGGLEGYVGDWFVNLVLAGAFILGGLGFPVVFEVARKRRDTAHWSLHTRVTLGVTAALLVLGTLMIGVSEWTNPATFGPLDTDERLLASFFQSATARTAGFNTVPFGELRNATWLTLIPLMVIGAGSASTGGGIKVSTVAVVIKATLAEIRDDARMVLDERHVSRELQRQALALVVAALGTIGISTFLLTLTHTSLPLAEVLFEAVSAFGTVGLSTGITGEFGELGRILLIVLMFMGRVGPITFGTAVLFRPHPRRFEYPEEDLLVG